MATKLFTMELGAELSHPGHNPRLARQLRYRIESIYHDLEIVNIPASQKDVDRIHALRLLAHSEIQNYLEVVADRILTKSLDLLQHKQLVTHAAHHLMVYQSILSLSDKRTANQSVYPLFASRSIAQISSSDLEKVARLHRKRIENNSGLKASNVKTILGPLGYRDHWYRPGLLDQLDSLGVSRGHVAHGTGLIGASNWPSGSSEMTMLAALQPGLEDIDRYVARLLMPV